MSTSEQHERKQSRGWRGRSVSAAIAIYMAGFAAILSVAAIGGAAWILWTDAHGQARQKATAVAESMGPALRAAVARGSLEGVHQALIDAATKTSVKSIRLLLPDGTVVADSDPTTPAMKSLPAIGSPAWLGSTAAAPVGATEALGAVDIQGPDRMRLRLDVRAEVPNAFALNLPTQALAVGVGFVGVAGFAWAFRALSRRLRAPGAVREALVAMARGERETSALSVAEHVGPEAAAWNGLLGELDRLKQSALAEGLRESIVRRGGGSGQLAHACDAMWHGLIVIDEKRRISYANGSAAVLLACRRERLADGTYEQHITDAQVRGVIADVFVGKVKRRIAIEIKRGDGQSTGVLRFSIRPIGRDEASGVVVFIEDVTQQRIADESRNSFVAQATHELRTPLTNIRLYVEQAIDAEHDVAARAQALNVINQESLRLERIVADMLSVSEIEAGSMKLRHDDVRLDQLFEDLRAEFMPQAVEKAIELGFELPPKLPVIQGDRDKIGQALHNLVGNALKYTKAGGKVTVRVECTPEMLTVDVSDTGIGIAAAEHVLVFEKFYRAKDKRIEGVTGTGLGLPLAREVARLHGGDVSLRSEINQGSVFTMTLPIVSGSSVVSQAA